ncbi:MAG: exonuclease domain-containing protein [Defluviitaleaceae bacterium]|nr:exonuclease domain-containing protein [Defluviitaleaceae bacterium]
MKYIVMDLEYNQPFAWGKETDVKVIANCPCEIIQIGIVIMSEDFEIIDKKGFLIKPNLYPRLHPFVKKITGLSIRTLRKQKLFTEIYDEIYSHIKGEDNTFCVWGGTDIKEFSRNILYYGLDYQDMPTKYIDAQTLASRYLNQPTNKDIGLKNAVTMFDLPEEMPFHDALCDAVYTAEVFKIVQNDEMQVNTFKVDQYLPQEKGIIKKLNSGALYDVVEKDLGRKLTQKEKTLFKKIYNLGKQRMFDVK